jgi:hypothetical protein
MSTTNPHADDDPAQAEGFAGRFLTTLNNGALCLMVSVGHRTGLLDVMSKLPPATSEGSRFGRIWTSVTSASGSARWPRLESLKSILPPGVSHCRRSMPLSLTLQHQGATHDDTHDHSTCI